MRRSAIAAVSAVTPVVLAASVVALAAPAEASPCSVASGGTNHSQIKANNAVTTDASGYNCAYVASTGTLTIAPATPTTVFDNSDKGYQYTDGCTYVSDSTVSLNRTITDGAGTYTSQARYDVSNTSTANKRWGGATLWMVRTNSSTPAANQYKTNCKVSASIDMNAFFATTSSLWIPAASGVPAGPIHWTMYISADGSPAINGPRATLYRQLGASQAPSLDTSLVTSTTNVGAADLPTSLSVNPTLLYGKVALYGDYAVMTPPSVGWLPSTTTTISVKVNGGTPAAPPVEFPAMTATRAAALPRGDVSTSSQPVIVQAEGSGDLTVRCPSGTAIVTAFAGSSTTTFGPQDVMATAAGSGLKLRAKAGHRAMLQLACRSISAPAVMLADTGWGSVGPDQMITPKAGYTLLGGVGADHLVGAYPRAHLRGGIGADSLELRSANSSAEGGPGADTLRAIGPGALLFGGIGADTFYTGTNTALVNARDGRGGDVIHCGSSATRVLRDAGDRVIGRCTLL